MLSPVLDSQQLYVVSTATDNDILYSVTALIVHTVAGQIHYLGWSNIK